MLKKSMVLTSAVAAILSSGSVLADASVNAAASNNYLWRGVTQSNDTASVSGGIDWSGESGLYLGVWTGSWFLEQKLIFMRAMQVRPVMLVTMLALLLTSILRLRMSTLLRHM